MDLIGGGGGAGWARIFSYVVMSAWAVVGTVALLCLIWWLWRVRSLGKTAWIASACAFAVVAALNFFREGVPIPQSWAALSAPLGTPLYNSILLKVFLFDALCGFCVISFVAVISIRCAR